MVWSLNPQDSLHVTLVRTDIIINMATATAMESQKVRVGGKKYFPSGGKAVPERWFWLKGDGPIVIFNNQTATLQDRKTITL